MTGRWNIFKWLWRWWVGTDTIDKLLFLVLIVFVGRPLLDLDPGWHLRAGFDLLKTLRIPQFDVYSHTLPDYLWVNHEWLSEAIVAWIYQHLGTAVLIMLFALIVIWAFWLAVSCVVADRKAKLVAVALATLASFGRWGVRMQMITTLGVGLIWWSLCRYRRGELKQLWWYILVFGLWANLHGGFGMGLGLIALVFVIEVGKWLVQLRYPQVAKRWQISEPTLQRYQLVHLFWVGLASGAVTLINPYGWRLYQDFYALFTNRFAMHNIQEWLPLTFDIFSSKLFLLYVILWAFSLIFIYRKVGPTRLIVALVLLLMAFLSRRNVPFFLLVSVGFLAEAINHQVRWLAVGLMRYRWLVAIIVVVVGWKFILPNFVWLMGKAGDLTTISGLNRYPLQAIQWAKAHPDQLGLRMYNSYNTGGFLAWQFPEQKVFIDGRMSYWQLGDRFVFKDSSEIDRVAPGAIQMMQQKYGVDWVLIDSQLLLAQALSKEPGWKLIYQDSTSVIYRKK